MSYMVVLLIALIVLWHLDIDDMLGFPVINAATCGIACFCVMSLTSFELWIQIGVSSLAAIAIIPIYYYGRRNNSDNINE